MVSATRVRSIRWVSTGIEVLAGLGKPVERGAKLLPGARLVPLDEAVNSVPGVAPEPVRVEVAHVPQLPGEQLDLEMAEAQGEEIGRRGDDCASESN